MFASESRPIVFLGDVTEPDNWRINKNIYLFGNGYTWNYSMTQGSTAAFTTSDSISFFFNVNLNVTGKGDWTYVGRSVSNVNLIFYNCVFTHIASNMGSGNFFGTY